MFRKGDFSKTQPFHGTSPTKAPFQASVCMTSGGSFSNSRNSYKMDPTISHASYESDMVHEFQTFLVRWKLSVFKVGCHDLSTSKCIQKLWRHVPQMLLTRAQDLLEMSSCEIGHANAFRLWQSESQIFFRWFFFEWLNGGFKLHVSH